MNATYDPGQGSRIGKWRMSGEISGIRRSYTQMASPKKIATREALVLIFNANPIIEFA
ncbi:TPA: hypothetical protein U2L31_001854 [Burkholderia contaminans]|nr:hypothetical protein [Burkholderia contaminans]